MIIRLHGKIEKLMPTSVELEVSGVVYHVDIALPTSISLGDNKICTLEIAQILREDSNTLYGFSTKQEKEIFLKLIKINGVGPKLALNILSTYSVQNFTNIIIKKDLQSLKSVKGVGIKLASKILLDLGGTLINTDIESPNLKLVRDALFQLGYKEGDISEAMSKLDSKTLQLDSSEIVKSILKSFSKK